MKTAEPMRIPEELQQQFHQLERRLWRVDSVVAVCGVLGALIVSYLMVLVSDRFWDTPAWLRGAFAGLGLAGTAYFGWGWARHWMVRRRDLRIMSGIVQRGFPRLGDRLLGIVELADDRTRPGNVSPALCRAAIRQVARETVGMDFRGAVPWNRSRRYVLAALGVLMIGLTSWALVPEAGWNALSRWLWPGGAVARFTFVNLESLPERLWVPHGEPFELSFGARLHPFWKPSRATARIEDQPELSAPVRAGQVTFRVPGQTRASSLVLRVGDVTRTVDVEPLLRPALNAMTLRTRLPEYLGAEEFDEAIARGQCAFVAGSRVAFRAETTRALSRVWMTFETAEGDTLSAGGARRTGEGFETDWMELEGQGRGKFGWADRHGLEGASPWTLAWEARPDEPPSVACPDQAAVVAMLPEEILEIRIEGRDDFGVRELAMAWECRDPRGTQVHSGGVDPVLEGTPRTAELAAVYRFSPTQLGMPADTLATLRALARDAYPGREPSESAPFKVYILSHEEHARLLQRELERVMAEVEEVTRRQEALQALGAAVREESARGGVEGDPNENQRRLAEQAAEQSALASKLARMAERITATMKEALRNKTLPIETLEAWARHAEAMQGLSEKEMAGAAQLLGFASRNPREGDERLEEALELEAEALKKLLELQRQVGPALDRMLATTLANRLRRIARAQARVRSTLVSLLPETIGLAPGDLTPSSRETLGALANDQDMSRTEARELEREIRRFHDRTQDEDYGTVGREMAEEQAAEGLALVAQRIRGNLGALAREATGHWEHRFGAWADLLEKSAEGMGSGGEGSAMSDAAMQRLLALLRLRQWQQNIRDHTQLLEGGRAANRDYREDAIILSIRQLYLKEDVEKVERAGGGRFLPEVRRAMDEAETFLMVPKTDEPVVMAETDAVNLLEAEIMDMLRTVRGSSLAAAMGRMMRGMGMGMGQGGSAGGSLAGGEAGVGWPALDGATRGAAGLERTVEKGAGGSTRVVPVEYREAIQDYHKALERIEAMMREEVP